MPASSATQFGVCAAVSSLYATLIETGAGKAPGASAVGALGVGAGALGAAAGAALLPGWGAAGPGAGPQASTRAMAAMLASNASRGVPPAGRRERTSI